MAVDASIYGAIRAPQAPNQLEQFAQMQQIQGAQNQNRLADLMFGEKQRESEGQTALANAYKAATDPNTGAIDRNKLYGALAQGGQGAKLPAVQKGFADQDKAAADTQKAKVEAHLKQLEAMGQILSGAKDQASWDAAREQAVQMFGPEAGAKMPAQYDPVLVAQKRDQALSVKDQLEQKWKAMEYTTPKADAVLSATTSTENNKRSVGASYANASATRAVAASNVEAAKIKGDRDTEMKIADDYRAQSKTFKEVSDAYKTINATLDKATTSAAATLAGATKFMKLLDPGSVVRESELGMALAATGAFDRATNYVNTLKFGKVLTKSQAEDFKNITAQIYGAAQAQQKAIDDNYTKQAKTYGLRPEMIVQDLGQNAPTSGVKTSDVLTEADRILAGGKK